MKKIEVAAAVIRQGQCILATQRGYGEFKDMWEFPGGKLETGESPEEALVREIREELEADIRVEEHLVTVECDYPAFHLTMHCYLCSVRSGRLTLKEHEAARWLDRRHLDAVDWLPADIKAVDCLKGYLSARQADPSGRESGNIGQSKSERL